MNILIRADDLQSRAWIEDAISDYSLTLFSAKTCVSMRRLLEHTHIDAVVFATPALFRESISHLASHGDDLPVVICHTTQATVSDLFTPNALKDMNAGKVFFIDDRSMAENRFTMELQRVIRIRRATSARSCAK